MKLTYQIIIGTVFGLMSLSSCKKLVQIPPSSNSIITSAVFKDSADATAGVVGMYAEFYNPGMCGGLVTVAGGLSADELDTHTTSGSADELGFFNDVVSINNGDVGNLWGNGYTYIYQANACMEGLAASTTLSPSLKNQLTGEAKFVRAFLYFQLVNLFGSVPLVTTTDYAVNESMGRTSVDSVYGQIIADLNSALQLLTPVYVTGGRVRPNSYSAQALLARVYLYRQEWDSATAASSAVINSGIYSLDTIANVFAAGSNEAIFQIYSLSTYNQTVEAENSFIPSQNNVTPNYSINLILMNAFESGDLRRSEWLDSNVVGTSVFYYPYKYQVGLVTATSRNENYDFLRLGEVYLIRAEAEAQTSGGLTSAVQDLNAIRSRAGLSNYNGAMNQASVLAAIYHERQIELFCEWGNRWYDLRRTGLMDGVLSAEKPGWVTGESELYPIPFPQMQLNPALSQNPGY
jgi:hypothetical protein